MKLNGKQVALNQLEAELAAASVTVRGLSQQGDDLFTYALDGTVVDVPAGAAAVVDAHVAQPLPQEVDDEAFTSQYQQAVTRLSDIVTNGGAYTAVQVRDATVDEARILRAVLRSMSHRVAA